MARAARKTAATETGAGTPRLLGLLAFIAASFAAGWLGTIPTSAALSSWYAGLTKAALSPPDAAFPFVWSILYLAMGIGAWLVWMKPGSIARNHALSAFFVQLALNAGWSWAFFGGQNPLLALGVIVALLLAIAWMTWSARLVSKAATIIFVPYLAWVAFATYLNAMIVFLN